MEMTGADMNKSGIADAPPQYSQFSGEPGHSGGVSVVDHQPPPAHGVGVTIVQQPTAAPAAGVVIVHHHLGPRPTGTVCRSCNQQIVTKVETKATVKTHLFAVLLCLIFCPCVCIPYCIDSCKTAEHYCPNCNAYIGSN